MSFARADTNLKEHAPAAVDAAGSVLMAGYDRNELVQKVAAMVWNSTLLQWERATSFGGGGGGSSPAVTTKRIDVVSATLVYVGEAEVGSAESASVWAIKKNTFDVNGNPTGVYFGVGSWDNRASVSYA